MGGSEDNDELVDFALKEGNILGDTENPLRLARGGDGDRGDNGDGAEPVRYMDVEIDQDRQGNIPALYVSK